MKFFLIFLMIMSAYSSSYADIPLIKDFETRRTSIRHFSSLIANENIRLSSIYFQDLKKCFPKLSALQKEALTKRFEYWNLIWFKDLREEPFSLQQLLDFTSGYSEYITPTLSILVFKSLDQTHEDFSSVCYKAGSSYSSGRSKFKRILNSVVQMIEKQTSTSWAVQTSLIRNALSLFDITTVISIIKKLEGFESIEKIIPFISSNWILYFLSELSEQNEDFRKYIVRFFSMDKETLILYLKESFQIISPVSLVDIIKSEQGESFVPFSDHLASNFLNRSSVRNCSRNLAQNIPSDVWKIKNAKKLYREFKSQAARICPRLSFVDHLALFTIQDKVGGWLLPLSARMAFAKQIPINSSITDYYDQGFQLTMDAEYEADLLYSFSGIEHWTHKLVNNTYKTSLHHIVAPRFFYCEALKKNIDKETLKALTYFFGLAYQLLDAKSKYGKIPMKAIVQNALADLKGWTIEEDFSCQR